jgi:uncharacterized alkaline shock family protein YloU
VTEPLVFRGEQGTITVTAGAVSGAVAAAARSVEGARVRRPRRAVEVSHDGSRAAVSLELAAGYGEPLPQLARAVQERVAETLGRLSGLEVERVDVEIAEVG